MNKIVLTNNDVVSTERDINFAEAATATSRELMEVVREWIYQHGQLGEDDSVMWVKRGVDCKVLLTTGGGWKKGKVRIRLEFIPDQQTQSLPLDDLTNDDD
ncbi:MAG: hypothetical protein KME23_08045 [Goleter apudmare HA4340-LM2]|jgi:hypothetical protein|nr:hypothetical protein [Goleter apudmare HA4340-LM2]